MGGASEVDASEGKSQSRIVISIEQCGLQSVASDLSTSRILKLYPALDAEDISQAIHFAAETLRLAEPAKAVIT